MSLLLLFAKPAEEILYEFPNLYVRDSQTTLNVAVGGLSGWDDSFLQSTTISQAPLIFTDMGAIAALASTSDIDSRRRFSFLTRALFSDAGANCVVRAKYLDKNDVIAYSDEHTIDATSIQINTDYIGELLELSILGAQKVAIYVASISAGTVNFSLACI